MILFNIANLDILSKGNPVAFLEILKKFSQGKILDHNTKRKLIGNSYLINPEPLFDRHNNIDILYKEQYVRLAAKRDYSLYKMYSAAYLDLSFFPDANLKAFSTNPLIKLQNNKLYFLYEEQQRNTNGNRIR